jgi:glycerophosphoryl diester phosphodiesterase
MRRLGLIAALVGFLLIFAGPIAGATSVEGTPANNTTLTIGHRGASGYAP